jgi:hypothetical protein
VPAARLVLQTKLAHIKQRDALRQRTQLSNWERYNLNATVHDPPPNGVQPEFPMQPRVRRRFVPETAIWQKPARKRAPRVLLRIRDNQWRRPVINNPTRQVCLLRSEPQTGSRPPMLELERRRHLSYKGEGCLNDIFMTRNLRRIGFGRLEIRSYYHMIIEQLKVRAKRKYENNKNKQNEKT